MFLWNCFKAPSISKMCSKPWALRPCEQLLTQPSGIDCQKHRSFTIKNICIALNAEGLVKEVNLQTANMAL